MQRLGTILSIYKPLFVWSFIINILLIAVSSNIFITILTKLFLFIMVLYFFTHTKSKSNLFGFKKFEISQFKIYALLFLIDSLLTISFLSVLSVYI